MLDWWSRPKTSWRSDHFTSGTSLETVPLVMAILHLRDGDINACLVEGARFGRDADAIASLSGSIAGALHGASAIRPHWIERVENANSAFFAEVERTSAANFYRMVGAWSMPSGLNRPQRMIARHLPSRYAVLNVVRFRSIVEHVGLCCAGCYALLHSRHSELAVR